MNTLGIFAKAPIPGKVKTRTQSLLRPEQAAQLQAALLRDTLAMSRGVAERRILFVAEGLDHPVIQEVAETERVELIPQEGSDLGARMARALVQAGCESGAACLIGTDSPHLPPEHLAGAFAALRENPVVVGPAGDGGYYLIGARGALPPIFDGVAWSTAAVFPETLRRLETAQSPYAVLPFWYDIDLPDDLRMLSAHLPALRRARPETCQHTGALLREWGL
jgi:hypothetical protein